MNKNRITLKEIYLEYDYKYYDVTSSTVPIPYFPKKEIKEHKYSLTYKEWKKVVLVYLKYLVLYLMSGKCFDIPFHMGHLCLKKWKPAKKKIDIRKTMNKYGEINKTLPKGEKKVVYHNNYHTRGYSPLLKWVRDQKKFPYKWHWRFGLSRKNWELISKELMEDSSMINRLIDC